MQYNLTISQTKALEWGLNAQQALLFAFVYECPSWTNPVSTEDGVFFALSKAKIIEELPLLTNKPDTAYRLLKNLEEAGVIELSHTSSITLVRLTAKGKEWNRNMDGSEKFPSEVGKKSEVGRKNFRGGSEKFPTNHDTSNHETNNQGKALSENGDAGRDAFELFWKASLKNGSKKKAAELFAAYCKRTKTEPMALALILVNDTAARKKAQQFGFDKLHVTTYLSQERWNDQVPAAEAGKPSTFATDFDGKEYKGTDNDDFADFLKDDQ